LAFIYKDLVPLESITETLLPLFESFKSQREGKESFGDYCARLGLEKLLAIA
jgi:sulfite reductase (ferredoxin)